LLSGTAVSPLAAQNPSVQYPNGHYQSGQQTVPSTDTGWNGQPGYRPVPKVRSSAIAPKASDSNSIDARRPGWNLRWRTSPQVASEQAREISDAAFAQPVAMQPSVSQPSALQQQGSQNPAPRIIATAADSQRRDPQHSDVVTVQASAPVDAPANSLRHDSAVRPVAWMTQQTGPTGGGFSLPGDSLPGDSLPGESLPGNAFRDSTVQPPANAEMIAPGLSFELPDSGVVDELPPPASDNPPASPPSSELNELFENNPPSSMRDLLQDEPPGQPPVAPEPIDEAEESPSDRETFAPNPFGNREKDEPKKRDDEAARDERDRDRLDRGDAPSIFNSEEEGPTNSGTGLSCDDFRNRIRSATIDQVSLDPSPPFRPDVIDEDEYGKLKGKFSKKQDSRTWRGIDGRPLGTGRLEDLAYEKAIIKTEFGSQEELPLNRLSEPDLAYISQNWGLPTECLIEQVAFTPRSWTSTTMTYAASNLMHYPLYFEEVNLERYGHTTGPLAQPIISSAHFFFNIAVLPYKMGVHSPNECQYALGYYRPGNCAPWIIPPVPLSVRGAWYQAAAMTGTALLVP